MRQMQVEGTLEASGLLARSYRTVLGELQLLAPLCAQLSPASARAILEPAGPMTWTPATWVLDTTGALLTMSGREACRRLGLLMSRDLAGGVLAPMVKTALALFGTTPAALYPRVQMYTAMVMRGMLIHYVPIDPRSGTLILESDVAMHDGFLAVWEGVFVYAQEACGVKDATVRPARLEPKGRRAQISVSW